MRPNKLRDLLKVNKPTLSTHIHTTWPSVVEVSSAADVQECVRIVRAETPEDKGTYGVATRRFTYMGYGGTTNSRNPTPLSVSGPPRRACALPKSPKRMPLRPGAS